MVANTMNKQPCAVCVPGSAPFWRGWRQKSPGTSKVHHHSSAVSAACSKKCTTLSFTQAIVACEDSSQGAGASQGMLGPARTNLLVYIAIWHRKKFFETGSRTLLAQPGPETGIQRGSCQGLTAIPEFPRTRDDAMTAKVLAIVHDKASLAARGTGLVTAKRPQGLQLL